MQAVLATRPDRLESLTRINLQDLLDNFGLGRIRHGRWLIERIFWLPAEAFARQVIRFDQRVGETGLSAASREMLRESVKHLQVIGSEYIPDRGPVLFAANHPGMVDTLACFAAIQRSDLRAVSADRPFTRALPNIDRRLFYVSQEPGHRLAVVRQITRFLNDGGAVLICPAGHIEPDPACMPGAEESLSEWSDSLALFIRRAPQTAIIPTIVSGVIKPSTLRSPLTHIRRKQKDRERVAATLQLLEFILRPSANRLNVRVAFGPPMPGSELAGLGSASAITAAITDGARRLLQSEC